MPPSLRRATITRMVALALAYCLSRNAAADPLPSAFDLTKLERAARRNKIVGNSIIAVGGAMGFSSLGLMIASDVRSCPVAQPGCNDSLDTAGTVVGGVGTLIIAVGITFWAIGVTQGRIALQLRAR